MVVVNSVQKGESPSAQPRKHNMTAQLYPGGWECESDSKTLKSEGMEDGVFSGDALYEAGLIGGGRHECLGPHNVAKLEPEEEENFRREARRAARWAEKSRPMVKFEFSKSMEDLLKTFPLIMGEKKVTKVKDEGRRLHRLERKRRISPGRKYETPPHLARSKEEEEVPQDSKSERVRAWLEAQI